MIKGPYPEVLIFQLNTTLKYLRLTLNFPLISLIGICKQKLLCKEMQLLL